MCKIDIAKYGSFNTHLGPESPIDQDQGHAGALDSNISPHIGVCPVTNRNRDGSVNNAPAERRADPIRAILVMVLALLMAGLQPWNDGYSGNAHAVASMDSAVVLSADHGSGNRDHSIPAASHCLLHAGCAVSLNAEALLLPVSFSSDWPAFIAGTDVGPSPRPDPKPPKFLT